MQQNNKKNERKVLEKLQILAPAAGRNQISFIICIFAILLYIEEG